MLRNRCGECEALTSGGGGGGAPPPHDTRFLAKLPTGSEQAKAGTGGVARGAGDLNPAGRLHPNVTSRGRVGNLVMLQVVRDRAMWSSWRVAPVRG
jgi:hypothetical protein